jgi:hypothetical protein
MISKGQVNRRRARLAYNSSYVSSLAYSLASTRLNKTQINDIQCQAIGKFLQKFGFEKFFPRAATYGPTKYGGIGMTNLYSYSTCQKIETIIEHINSGTSLGEVIFLVLEWIQCHCGVQEPFLTSKRQFEYLIGTGSLPCGNSWEKSMVVSTSTNYGHLKD